MAENNPVVARALDFLERNDAFAFDASPWESLGDNETASAVDWDDFFNPDNKLDLPGDFLDEIQRVLGRGVDGFNEGSIGGSPGTNTQWDVCAWYQPMHFFGPAWGIYIKEACLLRLAIDIARHTNATEVEQEIAAGNFTRYFGRRPEEVWVRAAFLILFFHEHYHHRTECLGFRLHVVTRTPHYVPYINRIYRPCVGSDDQIEEALANAAMYLRLSENTYSQLIPPAIRKAVRRMLEAQFPKDPPGYRMALNFLKPAAFDAGENLLQGRVRELTLAPTQPARDWDSAPRLTQSFFNIKSNIYTVVPVGKRSIIPRHVFPRSCSTDDLVRICRRFGYELDVKGGKGSHSKLRKPGQPTLVLPLRKDLSVVVVKNTLEALGNFKLRDLDELLAKA